MDPGFLSAVVLLLIVCDRRGSIPIFVSAPRNVPRQCRRVILLRWCVIAAIAVGLIPRGVETFVAGL